MTTSQTRDFLFSYPLSPPPPKTLQLVDLPGLPTCGRTIFVINTQFTPLCNHSGIFKLQKVPPGSVLGGGSFKGGSQTGRGIGTREIRESLLLPFKRNDSTPLFSESRGSGQSVTAAQHTMWWRVVSWLAWVPLQGKHSERIFLLLGQLDVFPKVFVDQAPALVEALLRKTMQVT